MQPKQEILLSKDRMLPPALLPQRSAVKINIDKIWKEDATIACANVAQPEEEGKQFDWA